MNNPPLKPEFYGKNADKCPKAALHTHDPSEPDGYIGWHEWAARKGRTHRMEQCPGCGFWRIWIPKGSKLPATA